MPNILNPNNQGDQTQKDKKKGQQALISADFDYSYPNDLSLKPGSEQHRNIKDRLLQRANESHRVMSKRYSEWERIDKTLRVYVPPEADEKEEKSYEIVVPESHATLDILLTYMSSAFLQDKIWTYDGVSPNDALGAMLMTHVVDHQANRFKAGLALHTQWRDAFSYGFGVCVPHWEREMGHTTELDERGVMSEENNLFLLTDVERRRSEYKLLYEGNKLKNIDPYTFLPDPNVAIQDIQDAEFVGWIERTNRMQLLNRDRDDGDNVFNAKYLKFIDGRSNIQHATGHGRSNRRQGEEYIQTNNPVDVLWMYVTLIPADWGLGGGEYPEEWLFGLAGDEVIVTAQPLGLDHGKKPISVCAPDYDGYSINPISRLGVLQDMQTLIDFLYTSHVQNIRKSVNDMLVIDPSLVNYYDVANPKPGKIIRMRRAGFGRGVIDQSFKQLKVDDITRQHIADAGNLSGIMQKVSAANENVGGGFPHRTTRISANEAQGARMGSLSRLEKAAKIISMQSMQPLGYLIAAQTQQLMEEDTYIKIAGDYADKLKQDFGIEPTNDRVRVSPLDLIARYDVKATDGTIPGSEDAQTWSQLFQILSQSDPAIAQQFNMVGIFKHIARQLGAKNVDNFEVTARTMPDEQVAQQEQRGNLRPVANE